MMENGLAILLFVVFALLCGALLRFVLRGSRVPYTVALLLFGLVLGYLVKLNWLPTELATFSNSVNFVAGIEPHLILLLFLPALVFESAFAQEVHLFRRMLAQISLLAVPGLILTTLMTAAVIQYVLPLDWSWAVALMFGALISATDPVAVVSLLKEQNSRKRLITLIEGESLLNDGTAIVFFVLFYSMVLGGNQSGLWQISWEFIRVVSLGMLAAVLVAGIVLFWVGRVFNDALLETVITFAAAYLVYLLAEHMLHASGVVAVVTLALLFAGPGRTRFSPEVTQFLHHFWDMLAYIFNTLIFLLVGIIIARQVSLPGWQMWLSLLLLYFSITLIRGLSIGLLSPLLARLGVGLTRDKAIVLTWGGLRGAVALALALTVAQQEQIPAPIRDAVLFFTAGIVVLTIVLNGGTFSALLKRLGLHQLPPAKQATVIKAEKLIRDDVDKLSGVLREDPFFAHVDWSEINERLDALRVSRTFSPAEDSHQDMALFYHRQLLESERQYYWNQFNQGLLTKNATTRLIEAVEQALDGKPELGQREKLNAHWREHDKLQRFAEVPFIRAWIKPIRFRQLATLYATLRGFLQAQQFVLSMANKLAPNPQLADEAMRTIERNIEQTETQVKAFKQAYGDTVAQLESYTVVRLLLNRQREAIHRLEKQGVLEPAESERMTKNTEHAMFRLSKGVKS